MPDMKESCVCYVKVKLDFYSHWKYNQTFDAPRNVASMFSKILFWRSGNLTLDDFM